MIFDEHTIGGGVFGICIILIFTLAILYDIIRKIVDRLGKHEDDESDNTSLDIRLLIYIDLFIILIHQILLSYNFAFASSAGNCASLTKFGLFVFHIIRCLLYLIFVRRLQVIYGDTIFALSRLHEYVLYGVIFIYSIPYICYINWIYIDTKYDKQFGCLVQYKSEAFFFIFALLELLIAIYCLYLFIFPLYKLVATQADKQVSYKLYNVMIKYLVLYLLSIVSCLLLIILSYNFNFGYNYSIIDGFMNGLILILLHPIHNKLYKNSICCCLHSIFVMLCDAPKYEYDTCTNKTDIDTDLTKIQIENNSPISCDMNNNMSNHSTTQRDTDSIRDIMKQKAHQKFKSPDKNIQMIAVNTCSPLPLSPSVDNITIEWKDNNNTNTNVYSHTIIVPPSPMQTPCNDSTNIIIMEDNEMNINTLTLKDFFSITSLRSVGSINTNITNMDMEEVDRRRSNTLKFINYESTKL